MEYFKYRGGSIDDKPSFKSDGGKEVNKITGKIKAVYHNLPETKNKKDGTPFEVAENVKIVFENDQSLEVSTGYGRIYRSFVNSLLSVEIGDDVEINTYISKGWKTISITKPKKEGEKLPELYKWAIQSSDVPPTKKVMVKGKEVTNDYDANTFFGKLLDEKFPRTEASSSPSSEKEETISQTDLDEIF